MRECNPPRRTEWRDGSDARGRGPPSRHLDGRRQLRHERRSPSGGGGHPGAGARRGGRTRLPPQPHRPRAAGQGLRRRRTGARRRLQPLLRGPGPPHRAGPRITRQAHSAGQRGLRPRAAAAVGGTLPGRPGRRAGRRLLRRRPGRGHPGRRGGGPRRLRAPPPRSRSHAAGRRRQRGFRARRGRASAVARSPADRLPDRSRRCRSGGRAPARVAGGRRPPRTRTPAAALRLLACRGGRPGAAPGRRRHAAAGRHRRHRRTGHRGPLRCLGRRPGRARPAGRDQLRRRAGERLHRPLPDRRRTAPGGHGRYAVDLLFDRAAPPPALHAPLIPRRSCGCVVPAAGPPG